MNTSLTKVQFPNLKAPTGFWRWLRAQALPIFMIGLWLGGFGGWLLAVVLTP